MNVLKLTISKKWFDMIKAGIKPAEYREIKKTWLNKFLKDVISGKGGYNQIQLFKHKFDGDIIKTINYLLFEFKSLNIQSYDAIHFYNGAYFSDKLPNFIIECKGISIGKGNKEWGAPDEDVFILKLGKIIKH